MGCRSDYLEQSTREAELQRAAKLYAFVLKETGKPVPPEVTEAAKTYYCSEDFVPALCSALKKLPADKRDALVYQPRNATARDLANWWETHQAADKKRIAEERAAARKEKLKASALAKLTVAERLALGLA